MMRSLYSGVSGLKNHQTRMDVIGNNIANVNTTAFKTSRTVFADIYSQTVRTASAGSTVTGGTNPSQIGLGVRVASIDILFTSGATQITDNMSDLAIEGDGFFVVDISGSGNYRYTRAGNFYVDNNGFLLNADGYFVMGYEATYDPTNPDDGVTIGTTLAKIDLAKYTNISFDATGVVWGIDPATEEKMAVAQVSLAMFTNNSGLQKEGNSLYSATANSGGATYTVAQSDGAGKINPGGLEMSNVDLASEFTDMIVTQRGFQANSRIITTSDSMLEELINLKR